MAGAPRRAPDASLPRAPGAAAGSAPAARRHPWRLIALLLLCAAPHLVRMASSLTVLADSFYGHAAYMLSRGHEPYIEFTQVAFPLAEGVLALALRAFGHDLRVFEVANLLVILAAAVALRAAARGMVLAEAGAAAAHAASPRRAASPGAADAAAEVDTAARVTAAGRAGAIAALAWSWSPWVIHFNLFERETWAALGTALALAAWLGAEVRGIAAGQDLPCHPKLPWRSAWAIAGGMALAFCIKITALMAALGVLAHLLLRGRARDAGRVAMAFGLLIGAATLGCWLAWGAPFLQQVFLFGFFRNPDHAGSADALARLLSWTDPVLACGFAALLAWGLRRPRAARGAPALVLLADLVFLLVISPTLWDHNLINCAPTGALLLAGALTARPLPWRAGLAAIAVVVGGIVLIPARYMPDMPGPFGPVLAGWTRDGIRNRAAFLQRYSEPDGIVCSLHAWWSVQAGRIEFIRYHDVAPIALGLQAGLDGDGLAATWEQRQGPLLIGPGPAAGTAAEADLSSAAPRLQKLGPYEGRLLTCSIAYERPLLLDAVARHEIALFMEPLPPHLVSAEELAAAGYVHLEDHELGIAGWRPADGISHPVVRAMFRR